MPVNAKTEYPRTVLDACMSLMQMNPITNVRIPVNAANLLFCLTFVAATMTMESAKNRMTFHCKRYV